MTSKVLDVFPQALRCVAVQASNDAYVELQVPTGLAALRAQQFRQNRRTVMEIMKIMYVIPLPATTAGDLDRYIFTLNTVSRDALSELSDRGCLYRFDRRLTGDAGSTVWNRDGIIDLTSGGIGVLCCTDNLYIEFDTQSTAAENSLYIQIFFRYVSISLQEYSDIKESQITYE